MSDALIYIEHKDGQIKKTALAGVAFGQQVVKATGGQLHLLVVGSNIKQVAEDAAKYGAAAVYVVDHGDFANYTTEGYAAALTAAVKACNATMIAGATSTTTKDVLPRVAARLEAAMASDVIAVINDSTFKRPMWAGNVIATVELTTPIKVCTVRATEFGVPATGNASPIKPLEVGVDPNSFKTKFASVKWIKSSRPELTAADRIVSVGRGAKGPEGLKIVEQLADAIGAAVGASRAAVDAGWVANDLQVGQTGKVVAPDLYIAIGVSGAIQHIAGMNASKVIVAINKDAEAPIFQVADYGLVADMFQAVPELIAALKQS